MCNDILNAYHEFLSDVIADNDRVQDYGFLDMYVRRVPERIRSNPQDNNIKIKLPESYKLVFKAGKSLKDMLDVIDK